MERSEVLYIANHFIED